MQTSSIFALVLLGRAPSLIVLIVGIFLAVTRWSRHPRVSLLASLGLGAMLMTSVGSAAMSALAPYLIEKGASHAQAGAISGGVAFLSAVVSAGAWVLLLIALFGGRSAAASVGESDRSN